MSGSTPHLAEPAGERDHVQGPADAPVTLVEYGDYECPYTGRAYPIVKEIRRALGDRLRFVFRSYPLEEIHPHAEQAAEAAEAAGAQGRFWEMHDALFEHQRALEEPHILGYARQLGLDVARFREDLAEHIFAYRIREDLLSGARSGVRGTPTFYINGQRHDGSLDYDTLVQAIRQAVQAA